MKHSYPDIYELAGDREPLWWDDNGLPRFRAFAPELVPNIYAQEVVLLLITCQECKREFKVSRCYDPMDEMWSDSEPEPFSKLIAEGCEIGYGDPPCHGWGFEGKQPEGASCSAGDTMTSYTAAVLEFWGLPSRKQPITNFARWERNKALEGPVPEDSDSEVTED